MRNETLEAWLALVAAHTCPLRIHWCNGSERELEQLRMQLQLDGGLQALDRERYPGCFVHRSDPTDAMPLEQRRFVSTRYREDVGPTNQWLSEDDAYRVVWPLFAKAMVGRTLFVVPYLIGSPLSKHAMVGVQLTDSPLVVLWMATLAHVGHVALEHLGRSGDFARGLHSSGDLHPERRFLVQFPATQTSWCIGSACPESAALFKSTVLSLASSVAPEEGFLAEHMSVARVTSPWGSRSYVAAAFPSGCGKTRLATLVPTLPEWRVELVADGACLLRVGDDGRLWAMNPAVGIDGLVGDTHPHRDPSHWAALSRDVLFTNVASSRQGSPWWEGCGDEPEPGLQDWLGRRWSPGAGERAAHPSARFVAPARRFPNISREFYDPEGVPLSAILFGGRRPALAPLVFEATSWEHGVYIGATSRSESPPNAAGTPGVLRNDPMGMLAFCSYNLADYFGHWLRLGSQLGKPPRIFHVNWFRADERGRLLWPGFGDNIRVLAWVTARVERHADARRTPIGFVPRTLETRGLELDASALESLLQVDVGGWGAETKASQAFLARFGERLPTALRRQHEALVARLKAATN